MRVTVVMSRYLVILRPLEGEYLANQRMLQNIANVSKMPECDYQVEKKRCWMWQIGLKIPKRDESFPKLYLLFGCRSQMLITRGQLISPERGEATYSQSRVKPIRVYDAAAAFVHLFDLQHSVPGAASSCAQSRVNDRQNRAKIPTSKHHRGRKGGKRHRRLATANAFQADQDGVDFCGEVISAPISPLFAGCYVTASPSID